MKFICTSSEYCQCRVAKGHQSSLCGFGGVCGSQATNNESAPLICECGDHITGDYAFVGGKYLCPGCMDTQAEDEQLYPHIS